MTPNMPTRPSVAYENKTFLESEDGRPLRIIAEYLEPLQRFRDIPQ